MAVYILFMVCRGHRPRLQEVSSCSAVAAAGRDEAGGLSRSPRAALTSTPFCVIFLWRNLPPLPDSLPTTHRWLLPSNNKKKSQAGSLCLGFGHFEFIFIGAAAKI